MWINFYNAKNNEQFSYEETEVVYILKDRDDYKLSNEESRAEYCIDQLDAEKVIGYGKDKSFLIPTMAESVKVGQKIYDKEGQYEGYRSN